MSLRTIAASAVLVLAASAVLSGCARPTTAAHDLALPSGEHVSITDAHGDSFADVNGVKRHIYYISYETQHDIDDLPALRKEALRVWAAFVPQISGADYDTCVVTPMKTMGSSEGGRPFYLKRFANGTWLLQQ